MHGTYLQDLAELSNYLPLFSVELVHPQLCPEIAGHGIDSCLVLDSEL
jgi:hypothetical protein